MNSNLIEKHIRDTNARRALLRQNRMNRAGVRKQLYLKRHREEVNDRNARNQVSNRTGIMWSVMIGIGSTLTILAYVGCLL